MTEGDVMGFNKYWDKIKYNSNRYNLLLIILVIVLLIYILAYSSGSIVSNFFFAVTGGVIAIILREGIVEVGRAITERRIKKVCYKHLKRIKGELEKRYEPKKNDKGKYDVPFNWTIYNEISGGTFLFELLLRKIEKFPLEKYDKTLEFFYHYLINMNTVKSRLLAQPQNDKTSTFLTNNTYCNLLERLDNALSELSNNSNDS